MREEWKKKKKNTHTEDPFLSSPRYIAPRRHSNSKACSGGGGKVNRWSILFDLCGAGTRGTITKCFRSLHSQAMVEVTRPSTLYSRTAICHRAKCVQHGHVLDTTHACRVVESLHYLLRISNFRYWTAPTLFTPFQTTPSPPPFFSRQIPAAIQDSSPRT